jgi:hypothetical protein
MIITGCQSGDASDYGISLLQLYVTYISCEDQALSACNSYFVVYLTTLSQAQTMCRRIMNWKGCASKPLWPNLRYYLAFAWRNWGKLWKTHDSRYSSRDSNHVHPEYKSEALPFEPTWSVPSSVSRTHIMSGTKEEWQQTMEATPRNTYTQWFSGYS